MEQGRGWVLATQVLVAHCRLPRQTLKRKGLGLESQELELEDGLDSVEKLRKLDEGVDLTMARPRLYVSSWLPPAPALYPSGQSHRECKRWRSRAHGVWARHGHPQVLP